jgi:hypothetical protein
VHCARGDRGWRPRWWDHRLRQDAPIVDGVVSRVRIVARRHALFGQVLPVVALRSGRGPRFVVVRLPDGRRRSILRSITDLGSEPFPEGRDSVDQSLRVSVRTLLPLARILAARPLSGICDASVSFADADAPTGSDRKITSDGSNSGGTLGGVTSGSQDAGRLDCREYDEADDSGRSGGAT